MGGAEEAIIVFWGEDLSLPFYIKGHR